MKKKIAKLIMLPVGVALLISPVVGKIASPDFDLSYPSMLVGGAVTIAALCLLPARTRLLSGSMNGCWSTQFAPCAHATALGRLDRHRDCTHALRDC